MPITKTQAGVAFIVVLVIVAIVLLIIYLPKDDIFVCTFNNMNECTAVQIEGLISSSCPEYSDYVPKTI